LLFTSPIGSSEKLSYLVKAGGIYKKVNIEVDISSANDIDPSIGWEFGLGVQYEFAESWLLRPMVGYHSLTNSVSESRYDFNIINIAFGLGIAKSF